MNIKVARNIVFIASSTGGTRVLREIFQDIGMLRAAIVITQHLAKGADKLLCTGLKKMSGMDAVLPEPSQKISEGTIYLCPCDRHMLIGPDMCVHYDDGPAVNYVRPSADVTMCSLKNTPAERLIGIVLTGIGTDGAAGIKHIKQLGGKNIAQSPDTCIIKDMPENAIATGCVDAILPPVGIRDTLLKLFA